MGLYIHSAADYNQLADQLTDKAGQKTTIFFKTYIITGHGSTNEFLINKFATTNGIAAQLAFFRILEFFEFLLKVAHPKRQNRKILRDKNQLLWLVDEVLQSADFRQNIGFDRVVTYFQKEKSDKTGGADGKEASFEDDEFKRFSLAEKIASLLLTYREDKPELFAHWKKNELLSDHPDEPWQRFIWERIQRIPENPFPDLQQIFNELHSVLNNKEAINKLREVLQAVHFFGNLAYSEAIIKLMNSLGEALDVHVYYPFFPNFSKDNRLLNRFGKLTRMQQGLLERLHGRQPSIGKIPKKESLLGSIQHQLLTGSSEQMLVPDGDASIVISSSYSQTREVEALYHYLVGQFESDPSLRMDDICVLIPDTELYAPAIKAHFSNPSYPLRYVLASATQNVQTSLEGAIEALFKLENNQLSSLQILSLLDFDSIRDYFGIENVELCYRAVKAATIRFGIDGDRELETNLLSWREGLKRLIYGYCLSPGEDVAQVDGEDFWPVDVFEGNDIADILRLHYFVEKLNDWLADREKPRSQQDWISFVDETVDAFMKVENSTGERLNRLLFKFNELPLDLNNSYGFPVFRHFLLHQLKELEPKRRSAGQGIYFLAPGTYFARPFRIYAFLGMNQEDFPRKPEYLGFDLRDSNRITQTDKDYHLFLQLLLLTKDILYLSYVGNNIRNHQELPPSSVITELQGYFKKQIEKNSGGIVIHKHPLHSFSKQYNRLSGRLVRYGVIVSQEKNGFTLSESDESKIVPVDKEGTSKPIINLDKLIAFLVDPMKHYYRETLGIYYEDIDEQAKELETFEPDSLQEWALKDLILDCAIFGKPKPSKQFAIIKKDLPLKTFGELALKNAEDTVRELLKNCPVKLPVSFEEISVNVEFEDCILVGKVRPIAYPDYLFVTASKELKIKHLIRAYLQYYALKATLKQDIRLHLLPEPKSSPYATEEADAEALLRMACRQYVKGSRELIFFSDTLFPYACSQNVETEEEELADFHQKVRKKLSDDNSYPSAYFVEYNHQHPELSPPDLASFKKHQDCIINLIHE